MSRFLTGRNGYDGVALIVFNAFGIAGDLRKYGIGYKRDSDA